MVSYGLQQAKEYAVMMDIPFAYSSNGDAFYEYDFLTGEEQIIELHKFPSREELFERYLTEINGGKGATEKEKEIIKIMGVMSHAYPRYELSADSLKLYGKMLADIPSDILEAAAQQIHGDAMRKVLRHHDVPDAPLPQQQEDNLGQPGPFDALAAELLLVTPQGQQAAVRGLAAGTVELQVAQQHVIPAAVAQPNERVRHEHAHGIQHVRVMLAVCDHQ